MYEKLSKLYYKLGEENYFKEYEKRKDSYGTYRTNLKIRGFKKGKLTNDNFELFYVNIPELMLLHNEVLLNSSKISSFISKLPNFIAQSYFHKLIVNAVQSTNEIEGVSSTKTELTEALKELYKPNPKQKRFLGLMKAYLHIEEIDSFHEVESFRALYDELIVDELAYEDMPDGKLFRNGYVEIHDGEETKHIGVNTEENIIFQLKQLIDYVKDETHPELYRYMVAHYFYEYIHPFYDGNGRTGRVILGSYLSRYLEKYSACTFSYAINQHKSKYFNALEEVPSPLNKGEMTIYLIEMLQLLSSGQKSILEDLELGLMKLERVNQYLSQGEWDNKEDEKELLYVLLAMNVFVKENIELIIDEFTYLTNKNESKISQGMQYLIEHGYVVVTSENPKAYKVCEKCLEAIIPV